MFVCECLYACVFECVYVCITISVCVCVRACDCIADDVYDDGPWQDLRGVSQLTGQSTPTYCPVLTHSGHLMFGIGDMDLHSLVSPDMVSTLHHVSLHGIILHDMT